ncbi:MAG: hypothetical protein HONDAALG_04578 [Gammaproteobacteria bacterium]|nr:hypothetical protein [Gammaproteobacteria bacterium]
MPLRPRPPARVSGAVFATVMMLAGCGGPPETFFPLDAGRSWDYVVTTTVLDETVRSTMQVRSLGTIDDEDGPVGVIEYTGNSRGYYVSDADGVRRVATRRGIDGRVRRDGPAHFILRAPYVAGTKWSLTSRLTLIESIFYDAGERIRDREVPVTLGYSIASAGETVAVPAGTFGGCLKVTASGSAIVRVNQGANFGHVDVEHTDWYAPGVGLVRSERRETSASPYLKAGTYVQELAGYR